MRWWLLAVGFLLALMAGAAEAPALMKAGPGVSGRGLNVRLGPAAPALPGNTVAFTAWWGLRAYSSAQLSGTTNAVRVRRASDNFEYDIKILPSGELDVGAGSGPLDHCAATTCFASILYDQTGNNACSGSCNLIQATAANQPQFIFNCIGTKPCLQTTATTMQLSSVGSFTPAAGNASLMTVANRAVGTGVAVLAYQTLTGNRVNAQTANTWRLVGGASGTVDRAAADAAWHVGVGVVTGTAASYLMIDGVGTAGTATGNTTAGILRSTIGNTGVTVQYVEEGLVDNVVLSAAQATALSSAARSYYGIP